MSSKYTVVNEGINYRVEFDSLSVAKREAHALLDFTEMNVTNVFDQNGSLRWSSAWTAYKCMNDGVVRLFRTPTFQDACRLLDDAISEAQINSGSFGWVDDPHGGRYYVAEPNVPSWLLQKNPPPLGGCKMRFEFRIVMPTKPSMLPEEFRKGFVATSEGVARYLAQKWAASESPDGDAIVGECCGRMSLS